MSVVKNSNFAIRQCISKPWLSHSALKQVSFSFRNSILVVCNGASHSIYFILVFNNPCMIIILIGYLKCHKDCVLACLLLQSCPTLCNPMNCSLPGFSVHGIPQGKNMEWVAMLSSRTSSPPSDQTPQHLLSFLHRRQILYL